ncbi:TPA: nucleotidyltransferase domain-containing protein [Campylobacter coli]|nr:nucleotidyltransferase domain-containing protein [Campylobacter coli]HEH4490212.1 nucleotidyltransferase domain-containing protein [Campylobacter coli]
MFNLKKENILKYLSSIKKELNQDGIIEIGLFGSYAKDKADIASDIDIVICSSEKFLKNFRGFEGAIYLDGYVTTNG